MTGSRLRNQFHLLLTHFKNRSYLDTTLTGGEPKWNFSGTLFEGIERWSERKQTLTHEDVKNRVKKALKMQLVQGIQYVRTHVDVTDPQLTVLKLLHKYNKAFLS